MIPAIILVQAALSAPGGSSMAGGSGGPSARTLQVPVPTPLEIVVGLTPATVIDDVVDQVGSGLTVVGQVSGAGIHLLCTSPGTTSVAAQTLVSKLAATPGTTFAELNKNLVAPEVPACSASVSPGAQECTVAFYDGTPSAGEYYGQSALAQIGAPAAQSYLYGNPSIVAVLDTGVDPTHPALAGRIAPGAYDFLIGSPGALDVPNNLDDDGDGVVDEAYGHGTHVAGTIALVNPDALLLPIRVLDSDGNGTVFAVTQGIYYAVAGGADVINLSLGMTGYSPSVDSALAFAAGFGVQVCASAGNTGGAVLFPGSSIYTEAIAALDVDDTKASFSAYGSEVDLAAPGVSVYGPMPGGGYAWWSGTSMATAVASGAASLMHSVATPGQQQVLGADVLVDTAFPVDALNPGYANLLGSGRADAASGALSLLDGDE